MHPVLVQPAGAPNAKVRSASTAFSRCSMNWRNPVDECMDVYIYMIDMRCKKERYIYIYINTWHFGPFHLLYRIDYNRWPWRYLDDMLGHFVHFCSLNRKGSQRIHHVFVAFQSSVFFNHPSTILGGSSFSASANSMKIHQKLNSMTQIRE